MLLFALLVYCHCKNFGSLFGLTTNLLIAGTGFYLACRQWHQTDYAFPEKSCIYKIRIQEKPEPKERSILCRSVLLGEFKGDTIRTNKRSPLFLLYFPKDSAAATLQRGDELIIYAQLAPPKNNGNPDEFDYARYLRLKGGSGTAYVPEGHWQVIGHEHKRTLKQTALDCRDQIVGMYRSLGFKGDELAVLSALTVGDKEELSDDIIETYSVSGASHVLALSGLHIGFLYALFWFVFSPLWKRWNRLKFVLLLFIVCFLWAFAFLTGLSPSVVRSVTMFSLLALSNLQPEKPQSLNTLAATAFLMLLIKPLWLFDVGFQLSFLAVTAILVIQPRLYHIWQVRNRFLRYAWGIVTVSVAAQIGTAPLVIFYFSRFSTHFLLTNLWVIPMVSLIMYAAVFLLVLTPFAPLQTFFAPAVGWLVRLQNHTLQSIESLPYSSFDRIWMSSWETLLLYLCIGLACYSTWRCKPRNVYLSLASFLALALLHSASMWQNAPRTGLAFYNIRGCPAVHCLTEGNRSWLVCADSLPDISRISRSLSEHWDKLRIEVPQTTCAEEGNGPVLFKNGIAHYAGRSVCFLQDDRWRHKTAAQLLPIDYLYICKEYKGNIAELDSLFSIRNVVFDASVPAYKQQRLIKECIPRGIPYLSLSDEGAFSVPPV